MNEYVSCAPTAWFDDNEGGHASITVIEPDDRPVFTGLYDLYGNKLYRVFKKQPIGYMRCDPAK